MKNSRSESYAQAGVDITAGYKAVELLRDDCDSVAIGIKNNKVITVPFSEVSKAEKKFDERLYEIAHVLNM